ncbi:hypothetical protein VTJ49DRAFT_4581 [Mycothermus thermophilus]|uniref:Uncharacterized protein n=1 Tax=Humicola insolens TaxID=85995 RepID=A0ABR3VL91_HUMIN
MAHPTSTRTLLLLSRTGTTTFRPRATVSASTALNQASTPRPSHPTSILFSTRPYHTTSPLATYKDDQDRNTLKPRPSDSTKSGSDDEVATKSFDAAFNPQKTSEPEEALASSQREEQQRRAGGSDNGNPLEVSGANPDVSKSPEVGDPGKMKGKESSSGWKKGKKHGKVSPM